MKLSALVAELSDQAARDELVAAARAAEDAPSPHGTAVLAACAARHFDPARNAVDDGVRLFCVILCTRKAGSEVAENIIATLPEREHNRLLGAAVTLLHGQRRRARRRRPSS